MLDLPGHRHHPWPTAAASADGSAGTTLAPTWPVAPYDVAGWATRAGLPDELAPNHLHAPALGIAATVTPGRIVSGKMEVPGDVDETSRSIGGAVAGAEDGTVLLVTCGGALLPLPSGGMTHADNVVATALPVGG